MSDPTTDMQELFSRDPLDYSKQDITAIVEKLRTQRTRFAAGIKDAGKPASKVSKATKAQEEATAITGKLDLGDLLG